MRILAVIFVVVLILFSISCKNPNANTDTDKSRQNDVAQREQVFSIASNAVPAPRLINFPLRRALAKFTVRQDLLDHPWYIYILGDNGNVVGYCVGQTVPINACNFLSSTERVEFFKDSWGDGKTFLKLTAPSLDGIFYGGGGTSSGCDSWFWFDAATDALIQIRGINWYAVDQPLRIEAEPITVQTIKE